MLMREYGYGSGSPMMGGGITKTVKTLIFVNVAVFLLQVASGFGRELEGIWGEKGFLRYYLTCGIGAGIVTYFFTMGSPIITIGASGAIFGILVAYAVIYPDRPITLLLFFVLPITMKAKHLVMGLAALEFLHCASGTSDGIGHFAHLGGAVVGYIYLRMWRRRSFYSTGYGETILSRVGDFVQKRKQKQAGDLEEPAPQKISKEMNGGGGLDTC